MDLTLKVWRQRDAQDKGRFETYAVSDVSSDMSFLEMLDVLNEKLLQETITAAVKKDEGIDTLVRAVKSLL